MNPPRTLAPRVGIAGGALAFVVAAGATVYHWVFGVPLGLGAYLTVVTLSTLGDARLQPHALAQYVAVAAVSLAGIGSWGLAVATVVSALIAVDIRALWRGRPVEQIVAGMRGHTVVVGGGRVGRQVADELRRRGQAVVVVEREPARAAELSAAGVLTLSRDARADGTLEAAGVARAEGVVLALPDDADNLFVMLALRDVAPGVPVVARAESPQTERHLLALGAQRVVLPTAIAGKRLARIVLHPLATDFFDQLVDQAGLEVQEVSVAAGQPLDGVAVRDLRGLLGDGVTLIALHRDRGFRALPPPDARIAAGDTLVLVRVAADGEAGGDGDPEGQAGAARGRGDAGAGGRT